MRKFVIMMAAAAMMLGTSACMGVNSTAPPDTVASVPTPPAPLASTQIDEKALVFAWASFEALLDTVDLLMAFDILTPESPRGLRVAAGIEATNKWLTVATEAARLGNAESYHQAFGQATVAMTALRSAIGD